MSRRLIITDDATIVRIALKDIVTPHGFEVVAECVNGQEAVEQFRTLRPDVITLDITMPEKDGLQALEEILAFDPNAKVVMMTALDQKDVLMKAIRLGACDYIVKPFEKDRVISALEKALQEEE